MKIPPPPHTCTPYFELYDNLKLTFTKIKSGKLNYAKPPALAPILAWLKFWDQFLYTSYNLSCLHQTFMDDASLPTYELKRLRC